MSKKSLLLLLALVLAACGSSNNTTDNVAAQSTSNVIHVSFVYSSEKQSWIDAVTKTFNASNPKTASGELIVVDAKPVDSGQIMSDVLSGAEQPILWSPSSSESVSLLNDAWIQKQGSNLISETCPNAAYSPLVIMMAKPVAQALGWPQKEIGWADLEQMAADPNSKFSFGHANPDSSDSGLQTILAMAYAADGEPAHLTVANVQDPKTSDFTGKLEGSIAHYASNAIAFDTAVGGGTTNDLSAAVVYESDVVNSYNAAKPTPVPLVAIYPKEGTFLSDHPLCLVNASWVTAQQREAANVYRAYLLSKPAQQQVLQFGFRPAEADIPMGTPLDSAHGVDPHQPQNLLADPDIPTMQAAINLWKSQKRQVNLTLLVDISGSMYDDNKIKAARDAVSSFIDQLDPSDTLSIIAFDDQQHVLIDNQNVGDNRGKMKQAVAALTPQGGTALYDAIAYAVKNMKVDSGRINAVIVLSDITDTNSTQYKDPNTLITDLSKSTQGQNTAVYTIGLGTDADQNVLQKIATQLKGTYTAATTANLATVYSRIAALFQ